MQLELDLTKSPEQNAEVYFEKAKKAKKKIQGIETTIAVSRKKLEKLEKEEKERSVKEEEIKEKQQKKKARKQEWYEKFRWFFSSEGFLVIGGRDATSNEIVIKKHTDKDDIVFHTDMSGSPFFVIKKNSQKKEITEKTLHEVADATLMYSKAWKLGMSTTDVFWVKPDQVSKTAQPGEYLSKGAFMIRGKTNYIRPRINLAIGILEDERIMGGPVNAVKTHCKKYVELTQGREKTSALAKKIRAKIGGDLDDIIKVIPAGGARLKKG